MIDRIRILLKQGEGSAPTATLTLAAQRSGSGCGEWVTVSACPDQ
jgi:hypothetical protein